MSPPAITPPVRLRIRADRYGVVVEEEPSGAYLRCDAEGRWTARHAGGVMLRRALDGRVHELGPAVARPLRDEEVDAAHEAAALAASGFAAALEDGRNVELEGVGDRTLARELLGRAAAHDAAWFRGDAARARAIHPEGVPILPPHRYRDLVVTPARGCPNATCTFCAFYRDRPFAVLPADAFDAHLALVAAHLGRALDAFDGVFLGSASAASLPDDALLDRLGRVRAAFGPRRRGVAAFLDADHAPRRTPARWARLVEAGLVDVTVGLETGLAPLRASVGKSGDVTRFVGSVAAAKAANVRIAVCVLVGLGGPAQADAHRAATVAAIGAMPLGKADLVYLSPLAGALPDDAIDAETAAWRAALAPVTPARASHYPAEGFVARS